MSNSKKLIIAAVVAGGAVFLLTSTPTNATELKSGDANADPNASKNQEIIS